MSDHPTTFQGEGPEGSGFDWNDHAALHRKDDGQGILEAMKAISRGTLAEMVARVMAMPESERGSYVIQKSGDHRLEIGEILALSRRNDFPGAG